ncbi:hypothetical protein OAH18_00465 [bacterium]|nr:hypothetical protein [bacterium]
MAGNFLTAQTETRKRFSLFRRDKTAEKSAPIKDGAEQFKMFYMDVTWDRVLKDVASKSGSQLVMSRVPSGRLVRTDRNEYTREEAVRILNAELESKGFRIAEKNDFLVVMDLKESRAKYQRPDYPSVQPRKSGRTRHRLVATPRNYNVMTADGTGDSGRIRQTGLQDDNLTFDQLAANTDERNVERAVRMKNQQAADVARQIYDAFRDRSELDRNGPNGLPSFKVYRNTEDVPRKLQVTIAIDRARNELRLYGKTTPVKQMSSLVNRIDQPVGAESISIFPDDNANRRYASQLQRQMNRLVARPGQTFTQANTGQQPGQAPASPSGQDGTAQDQIGAMTGGLRGNVDIEALEDYGVLLIRGNEADVAQVEDVIKRIEELSEGTTPEINIHTLTHVNSESMAALLENVYEQLSELRSRGGTDSDKSVTFIPVITPNAILILSSAVEMESIIDLVDRLDKPVDPETEFQVFPLKYAISSQVVEAVTEFYGDDPQGLAARVQAYANVRGNSVIVQARPNDMAQVEKLIADLDKDDSGAVSQMKVIKLKNSVAEELLEAVNSAIGGVLGTTQTGNQFGGGGGGQNSTVLQETKSVVLEFLANDGQDLVRSGILADIKFGTDPRTNSIIVTAPESSMILIEALIRELDQPATSVAEIKAFTLKNTDAVTAVELLSELFDDSDNADGLQVQLAGAEDATSSLIPLRFSSDSRTNTVLAIGGEDALRIVEAILLRLDTSENRSRESYVRKLEHSLALDVAEALNDFLASRSDLLTGTDDAVISEIERLRQEVVVQPEETTNTLLISADPSQMKSINAIIDELDSEPPEIAIQALIVEVQLDNVDEFGMELGFQDSLLFNRGTLENVQFLEDTFTDAGGNQTTTQRIISSEGTPGFQFNNSNPLGNNTGGGAGNIASQGLSNFSLGRANTDLGYGGFVFSASSGNVSVLLRALSARRQVQVLSRPHITARENYTASIDVGSSIGVIDGVTAPTGLAGAQPIIVRETAGIFLQVTPRVTKDNVVVMEVDARSNQLTGQGTPVYQDPTTGTVFETPIIDITNVLTQVAVPNGQTVVLGGMITKTDDTVERKVPWLGDIPILGIPFRYDSTSTVRTELLIFLTPRVIRNDADRELIKQIETERLHFLESEAEDIHGPIFSLPPKEGEQIPYADYGGQSIQSNESQAPMNSNAGYPVEDEVGDPPEFDDSYGSRDKVWNLRQTSGKADPKDKNSVSRADYKRATTRR